MAWFVYIVECQDGTLYTGCAVDVPARVKVHNDGKGAKYTKTRRPIKLVYQEERVNRSDAQKREYEIKQYSAMKKREMTQTFKRQ